MKYLLDFMKKIACMNWRKIINYWTVLIGEINGQEINLKRVLRGWAELVAVWITCMLLYGFLLYIEGGNESFIIPCICTWSPVSWCCMDVVGEYLQEGIFPDEKSICLKRRNRGCCLLDTSFIFFLFISKVQEL